MELRAIEYVEGDGRLLAIVVRADFDERGTAPSRMSRCLFRCL
jgi:hypothetical protein